MANYTDVWRNYFVNQNTTNDATAKKFLGSNFDYLQNNLKKGVEGNNPIFDQIFGNASRRIGASTDRAVQDIKEQGAQSGFRGAGGNLINDAYRNEGNALSQVSDSLAGQKLQYQQNAIAQLLGLNQFEGNQYQNLFNSDRQNMQFQQGFAENRRQFDEQMANQPSWWEGILGSLIGGGAQVGSAALLASDERIKENIKKVDKRGDIDIVEFNYIGHPQRFRGVTAQQIEANHPEAVQEINGIKFVDYSKIGVTMKAV